MPESSSESLSSSELGDKPSNKNHSMTQNSDNTSSDDESETESYDSEENSLYNFCNLNNTN